MPHKVVLASQILSGVSVDHAGAAGFRCARRTSCCNLRTRQQGNRGRGCGTAWQMGAGDCKRKWVGEHGVGVEAVVCRLHAFRCVHAFMYSTEPLISGHFCLSVVAHGINLKCYRHTPVSAWPDENVHIHGPCEHSGLSACFACLCLCEYQVKGGLKWAGSRLWDGIEYMGEVRSIRVNFILYLCCAGGMCA